MYDSSNPNQRATTDVIITVQRNVNSPVFRRSNYLATVVENYPIGESVVKVEATDGDGVSGIQVKIRSKSLSTNEKPWVQVSGSCR